MQSKCSKISQEKRNRIIHQVVRYVVLAVVIVFAYLITGALGIEQRMRGCIMGLIALCGIRYFKDTRLLPQNFLETPKLDAMMSKIITIMICALAAGVLIYAIVVLCFMEK